MFSCPETALILNETLCNISFPELPLQGIPYIVQIALNDSFNTAVNVSFQLLQSSQFNYTFYFPGSYKLTATELTSRLQAVQNINITDISSKQLH